MTRDSVSCAASDFFARGAAVRALAFVRVVVRLAAVLAAPVACVLVRLAELFAAAA
jgi:hypothetical protein